VPLPARKATDPLAPSPASGERAKWRVPLVFEGDVFALVDDGQITAAEYMELEQLLVARGAAHSGGLGCVVVIPAGTKPPSEAQRVAIASMLTRAAPFLTGLAWVVEGRGFEGAAVRGILLGLSLFGRRPYPTHVGTELRDALGWLATRRAMGSGSDLERTAQRIAEARALYAARK
jgi:hypothetical protein